MKSTAFSLHLLLAALPVPRVLASASGETAIEIGEWTYEVHETPAGIDLYEDAISWTPFRSAAHAHSAGQALARLHLARADFAAPPRKPRPLVASFTIFAAADPAAEMDAISPRVPRSPTTPPFAPAPIRPSICSRPFIPSLRRSCPRSHRSGPTTISTPPISSGAMRDPNPIAARATAIIDFGLADRTNAVHDLAHAIERNIVEWFALVQRSQTSPTRARPPRSSRGASRRLRIRPPALA